MPISLIHHRFYFAQGEDTKRPSRGCGIVGTMLVDNKLLRSTYLHAKIWLTILAGIGVGPTTNGCCSSGPDSSLKGVVLNPTGRDAETGAVSDIPGLVCTTERG